MRIDPNTGKYYAYDTIQLLDEKIKTYKLDFNKKKEIENPNPFALLSHKYSGVFNKKKIVELYLEDMKNDLYKNFGQFDSKSNKSMLSASSEGVYTRCTESG